MQINFSFGKEFDSLMESLKQNPHYEELATLDGIGEQTDMVHFSKEFFGKPKAVADVSVDSNANVEDSSIIAYEAEVAKPLFRINAYYILYKYAKKLYGEKVAASLVRGQFEKDYYINDFHKFAVAPYCFNFSCLDVTFGGLPFVKKIKSNPPKHLSSFMGQMVQFVTYASNSVAGAVGLADLFVCMSWYIDKEYVPDAVLKQELQSFIYSVNQPFRGGHQSAFTNVSVFDTYFLDKMCEEYTFPDGTKPRKETIQRVQDMFLQMMNETLAITPCTFPVTTACFSVDDERNIRDEEFLDKIVKVNQDYAWINIFAGKTSVLSSCCRLRSESNHEYFNSFGSGGTKIGSMSVVTINLPRLAYRAVHDIIPFENGNDDLKKYFLQLLQEQVEKVAMINNIKRYVVQLRAKNGNLPLYSLGFMDVKKQYSTCGVNGINEAVEIMGYDILKSEGIQFVHEILDLINSVNASYELSTGYPHNMEQTPSENSAIKLAQADKIMGYNQGEYELYSNQFIPLTTRANLLQRVMLQGEFDQKMTGGAIMHVNCNERVTNPIFMKEFLKASIKQGVVYQAINYVLNVCEEEHVSVGNNTTCPVCGKPIKDQFTRVVGFLTNVKNWHKVRRTADFPKRQFYNMKEANQVV